MQIQTEISEVSKQRMINREQYVRVVKTNWPLQNAASCQNMGFTLKLVLQSTLFNP